VEPTNVDEIAILDHGDDLVSVIEKLELGVLLHAVRHAMARHWRREPTEPTDSLAATTRHHSLVSFPAGGVGGLYERGVHVGGRAGIIDGGIVNGGGVLAGMRGHC
jgi:hypothetical protein